MKVDLLLIFTLLSIFSLISLAVTVWLSRANRVQKLTFFIFSFSVSTFLAVLYLSNIDFGDQSNLILNRGVFVVAPWMVFAIDGVIRGLLDKKGFRINIPLLVCAALLSVFASTGYFIEGTYIRNVLGNPYPSLIVSDWVYYPFVVVLVAPIFPLILKLLKRSKEATGFDKQRAKSLLLSTVTVFVLFVTSNIIVPSLGLNDSSVLAPVWMLAWAISIYYSIANQRLFGIRNIASKLIHSVLSGIVWSLLFILFYSLVTKFGIRIDASFFVTTLPVYILLVFLSQVYSKWSPLLIDRVLGIKTQSSEKALNDFIMKVSRAVGIKEIFGETKDVFENIFQADRIVFYVETRQSEPYVIGTSKASLDKSEVYKVFKEVGREKGEEKDKILFGEELLEGKSENRVLLGLIEKNKLEVIAPIYDGHRYVGVVIIQSREDGTAYSIEEVVFLRQIISNVTIALVRSLLFKEIQEFNLLLQTKVEEATKDLRDKNMVLRKLRERERDMMDIIGHELRTPLSIIKITLGLMKDKLDKGREITPSNAIEYYNRMKEAIQREIRLLETMISSTKIESENMQLYLEKVDICPIVNDAITAQKVKLKEKELEIVLDIKASPCYVYGDKLRIPEIFDNFIGNAVKFTDKGKIGVSIDAESLNDFVRISIKDTGIGIPQSAIKHLGKKFYRVSQHTDSSDGPHDVLHIVRPGGTGLGLYVTFNLIKLMGGSYEIESEEGKGSTFTFTLPKYLGQKESGTVKKGSKNIFEHLGFTHSPH